MTFATPYAGWKGLFGGGFGIYPSHLLEGKDRNAEMANGYTFSGGPWMLESWNKGVDVTLVPNPNYWGEQAEARRRSSSASCPTRPPSSRRSRPARSTRSTRSRRSTSSTRSTPAASPVRAPSASETGNFEALWINNAEAPFDSVAVRQAFAYSLDRAAIVEALFGGLGVDRAAADAQRPDPLVLLGHRGVRRLHAGPRQGRRADDR